MADFDHSHITPEGYLKSWAVGKQLALRLVEVSRNKQPVDNPHERHRTER
jgi:hypothetical protein